MVFGTDVHELLSGEVWRVTCVVRLPVVEYVTRQLTHGVLPEMLDRPVMASSPVNVKVNEQSGLFCAASGRHTRRAAQSRVKGMALRKVVMPHSLRLFR